MGIHLVAIAVARGFLAVFNLSAPLLWPLNLWVPLARHLPEACLVLHRTLTYQIAWLRRAYARGTVWSHRRSSDGANVDEFLRQALMNISY